MGTFTLDDWPKKKENMIFYCYQCHTLEWVNNSGNWYVEYHSVSWQLLCWQTVLYSWVKMYGIFIYHYLSFGLPFNFLVFNLFLFLFTWRFTPNFRVIKVFFINLRGGTANHINHWDRWQKINCSYQKIIGSSNSMREFSLLCFFILKWNSHQKANEALFVTEYESDLRVKA